MHSYFAHNGVQHATAAEAAGHEGGLGLPVVLAVTAVVGLAAWGVIWLLSRPIKKGKHS